MAKRTSKHPVPPTLMRSSRPPRLEGDDLFNWAQLVTRTEHMLQAKTQFAVGMLMARGYTPGPSGHLLTDDGYIVTPAENQQAARVRSILTEPAAPDDLPVPSPPPGSES